MPLGFERLNERTQRPNAHINFIRTLGDASSTASAIAQSILNRVAAICYPLMKKHHIYVQALEEFPFNHEFVGRNFNAGEVIQLVLKNRRGEWLPEKWIMMVMVHELAHCKQMNHSKAFWKVRDEYAADLRALWIKGYTGEGLWGRGRALDTGAVGDGSVAAGDVPEHICGGTYGRRRKRRRAGKVNDVTYAEKKQRRILKKFGAGGQALGADDATKVRLEGGVAKKGKPRVAGSARGRELRAAAALARFEQVKKEDVTVGEALESDSGTEDDCEHAEAYDAAIDVNGKKMVDEKGRALVKICDDDEDSRDENARREMDEIADLDLFSTPSDPEKAPPRTNTTPTLARSAMKRSTPPASGKAGPNLTSSVSPCPQPPLAAPPGKIIHLDRTHKRRSALSEEVPPSKPPRLSDKSQITCAICSLINEPGSPICMACSNVLNFALVPNHWECRTAACFGSQYVNSADADVCGVCGTSRSV